MRRYNGLSLTLGDYAKVLALWLVMVAAVASLGFAAHYAGGRAAWAPDHDVVMQAWGWANGCTGHYEDGRAVPRPGRLDQVVWVPFDYGARDAQGKWVGGRVVNGSPVKGQWVAPDTIFVAREYAGVAWVLAHELVHHILGGPPGPNAHPADPFLFPCQLMMVQNAVHTSR